MLSQFTGDDKDPLHNLLSGKDNIGIILYPDGGFDEPTQRGGWGVHGYIYSLEVTSKGSGCPSAYPTADGYTKVKPNENLTILGYLDFMGSVVEPTTNNITELIGLTRAVQFINQIVKHYPGIKKVQLYQDSQYAIKSATVWGKQWRKNGWCNANGEPIKNVSHLETLLDAWDAQQINIQLDHVKGHSGNLGNDLADALATDAKAMAVGGIETEDYTVTPAQGYWRSEADFNPVFRQNLLTFVTNTGENKKKNTGKYYYHFCNIFKDSVQGERHAYNAYSVVHTTTPDPVLQTVINYQNTLANSPTHQTIVEANMGLVLNKRIYAKILSSGDRFFMPYDTPRKYGRGIQVSGAKITGVFNPPLKAYSVLEIFDHLHELLDGFTEGKNKGVVVTEITDIFYEPADSKKPLLRKLKKEITTSQKVIKVAAQHELVNFKPVELRLVMEVDMPSRNVLSAISGKDPKVSVITWTESEKCVRYATVVTTTDTNVIYCSPYSNARVLCV